MKNDLITAFMIKNKQFEIPNELRQTSGLAFERGYANGYIAIPRGHELYGKHYDEIPLSVHGGWTFSEYASVLRPDQLEFVDGNVIAPNSWVIGFDTAHFGDNLKNRDRNFVVSELKTVLKNLRNLN